MSLAYLAQDADHQKIEWLHGGIMSVLLDGDKTNGQPHRHTCSRDQVASARGQVAQRRFELAIYSGARRAVRTAYSLNLRQQLHDEHQQPQKSTRVKCSSHHE